VFLREELSPESQKSTLAILIADGAPISRWPVFVPAVVCRGLSRWLNDRIDLRFTTIQCANAIFDEDPRKKSRAKWHKASKKA
jgi:hypothetical protein